MTLPLRRPAILAAALLTILSLGATRADAEPIWAVPVAGIGSHTTVGIFNQSHDPTPVNNDPTPHWIKYYIPLTSGTSGTYGVNAGTIVDTGSGGSYLRMFLLFEPVTLPAVDATLTFEFSDLDLSSINDPDGFFETMRLYDENLNLVSPHFTESTGSGTNGVVSTGLGDINWTTTRTAGSEGKNWPFVATFTGPGLTALVEDPFWMMLKFTVPPTFKGTNTPEYLRASLTVTNPEPVPEPATLLMLGAGLAGAARSRMRKARRRVS